MEMIHITCSFDSKCTRFASVLMTSVFENKKMKNHGVLFIDLQEWRKQEITKKCFEYLNPNKPMHFDQDTLNAVLQGK